MYNMKNLILTLSFLSLSGVSAQSARMINNIFEPRKTASLDLEYESDNQTFHKRFEPLPFTVAVSGHEVEIPADPVIKKATWFIQEDNTEVNCNLASEGVKLSDIRTFSVYRAGPDEHNTWMTCHISYKQN